MNFIKYLNILVIIMGSNSLVFADNEEGKKLSILGEDIRKSAIFISITPLVLPHYSEEKKGEYFTTGASFAQIEGRKDIDYFINAINEATISYPEISCCVGHEQYVVFIFYMDGEKCIYLDPLSIQRLKSGDIRVVNLAEKDHPYYYLTKESAEWLSKRLVEAKNVGPGYDIK